MPIRSVSRSLKGPALLASLLLGLGLAGTSARAANTAPGEVERFDRSDYVSAGIGGIGAAAAEGGGTGTIELSGLSGTVTRAYLYWEGIDWDNPPAYTGGNYDYDEADILLDGEPLTGVRAAEKGFNNCWPASPPLPPDQSHSAVLFRADVTAQVLAKGNGDYLLAGLADGAGHSANGASLIVFYNDADSGNDRKLVLYDSMSSNSDPEATEDRDLSLPIDYAGGTAIVELHVADGQSNAADGEMAVYISPGLPSSSSANRMSFAAVIDGVGRWAGQTVPAMGFPRNGPNNLWDIRQFDVSGSLGKPQTYEAGIDLGIQGDCVSSLVELVSLPADPQPTLIMPNPHDFGDVIINTQSAPQRFTLTNNQARPLTITAAAGASSTLNTILADTCAGQTLAPGASCTVDADCRPRAYVEYHATSLSLGYQIAGVTSNNTAYAELLCAGVPAAAFARLSFTDPPLRNEAETIDFGSLPEGSGQSVTRRFVLTSTGNLPAAVDAVTVSNTGSGTNKFFHVGAETCTGRSMAPGQTCTVDAVFQPNPANANPGTDLEGYIAVSWDHPDSDEYGNGVVSVDLSGRVTDVASPGLYLDPTSRDFGSTDVGVQTGTYPFTARNFGNEPLVMSTSLAGANPGDFVYFKDECSGATLAVNAICTVYLRFLPQAAGSRSAQLRVAGLTAGGLTLTSLSELSGTGVGETPPGAGQIAFGTPGQYEVGEGDGVFRVPVVRVGGDAGAVSVTVSTANGSAVAPGDYTEVSTVVNFADGSSGPLLVDVPIAEDALDEADESIQLTLSMPTGGATLGQSDATLTIVDDDELAPAPQPGTLAFGSAQSDIAENAGRITVTVRRNGGSDGAASVSVATADGSARAGGDYAAAVTILNWADGDSSDKSLSLTIFDDTDVENSEVFTLALSAASGATLGSPASTTITITDDDESDPPPPEEPEPPAPQPGTLLLSAATARVTESAGMLSVTLWRSGGSDGAASVTVTTGDGSARAGSDYAATTATVNWADGDAADKTLSILILDDAGDEGTEVFTVALSNAVGAMLGAPAVLTVSLDDDDEPAAPAPPQQGELSKGGGALAPAMLTMLALLAVLRRCRRLLRRGALVATLAFAPAVPAADFYLGAQAGSAWSSLDSAALTRELQAAGYAVAADIDNRDTVFAVYGGWWFMPEAALEVGYRDLGEYRARLSGDLSDAQGIADAVAGNFPGSGDALSLALRLDYPLSPRLSLRPNLGLFAWRGDVELTTDEGRYKAKSDGLGLQFGVGVDLKLTPQLRLGLAADLLRPGDEGAQRLLSGRIEWAF